MPLISVPSSSTDNPSEFSPHTELFFGEFRSSPCFPFEANKLLGENLKTITPIESSDPDLSDDDFDAMILDSIVLSHVNGSSNPKTHHLVKSPKPQLFSRMARNNTFVVFTPTPLKRIQDIETIFLDYLNYSLDELNRGNLKSVYQMMNILAAQLTILNKHFESTRNSDFNKQSNESPKILNDNFFESSEQVRLMILEKSNGLVDDNNEAIVKYHMELNKLKSLYNTLNSASTIPSSSNPTNDSNEIITQPKLKLI